MADCHWLKVQQLWVHVKRREGLGGEERWSEESHTNGGSNLTPDVSTTLWNLLNTGLLAIVASIQLSVV